MDITYKTNKYRQPLLKIVGMASTKLVDICCSFACMEFEKKTYVGDKRS